MEKGEIINECLFLFCLLILFCHCTLFLKAPSSLYFNSKYKEGPKKVVAGRNECGYMEYSMVTRDDGEQGIKILGWDKMFESQFNGSKKEALFLYIIPFSIDDSGIGKGKTSSGGYVGVYISGDPDSVNCFIFDGVDYNYYSATQLLEINGFEEPTLFSKVCVVYAEIINRALGWGGSECKRCNCKN
jgi:hypothetical protein